MDEKPDQIMNHIDSQRHELGRNLNELESRVKGATDWRVQFDRNPMLMMGVALGGGLLLGTMVGGKRGNRSSYSSSSRNYRSSSAGYGATGATAYGLSGSGMEGMGSGSSSSSSSLSSSSPALREQRKKATDTLEHMKAALVGFAIAKVKEFMSEALPGFDHHLNEAERKNQQQGGSGQHSSSQQGGSGYGSEQSGGYSSSGSQGSQASTRGGEQDSKGQYGQSYNQQPVGANPGLNI